MVLSVYLVNITDICFLCMRRDVSVTADVSEIADMFSLHAQRCFLFGLSLWVWFAVFSACAEMFLAVPDCVQEITRFLCMRRDVSDWLKNAVCLDRFSLHAQRCFRQAYLL